MKYYIETFGCQMNVHESEKLAGSLSRIGYSETKTVTEADITVFNTCCIRDTAEKKIFGRIGDLKNIKLNKPSLIVAVVGCMSQQDGAGDVLRSKFPFIDIILGTANADALGEKVLEILSAKNKRPKIYDIINNPKPEIIESKDIARTSFPNAWINIMYGCNNFCSYCIVPYVRGRERSREPQAIIKEAEELLKSGYKELTLLGQNVNSYTHGDYNFARLLKEIAALPYGKFRIRFMTSHPKDFSEEIADVMLENPNICKNIHLPVQSGSDNVLKAMNRRYTREDYFALIDMIRTKMPAAGITSDIMIGFPGETDADFLETLNLARRVRFSAAFTFVYSRRKGTEAAKLPEVDKEVKKQRIMRLVALQNEITAEISASEYLDKTFEVLAEDTTKKGFLCGRTESGRLVNFPEKDTKIGEFKQIHIDKVRASALWGYIDE